MEYDASLGPALASLWVCDMEEKSALDLLVEATVLFPYVVQNQEHIHNRVSEVHAAG